MKYLLRLMLFVVILSGCEKDESITQFQISYNIWLTFRNSADNTYNYKAVSQSWAGTTDTTSITVINGIVSARKYVQYTVDTVSKHKILTASWEEDISDLNSHEDGAPASTLDEVYEKARTVWLAAEPSKNSVYLKTDNNGIISLCGFVPHGCIDDCFVGIHITSIAADIVL